MSFPVRFLADESCDFLVVKALRSAGYDVAAVSETSSGAPDEWVLGSANADRRILITEDRDFGEWVFGRLYPLSTKTIDTFLISPRQVKMNGFRGKDPRHRRRPDRGVLRALRNMGIAYLPHMGVC